MRWGLLALLAACGGSNGGGGGDGGHGKDAGATIDAAPPSATCTAPALADITTPTTTIGTGDPSGCTEAALRAAAMTGGTIVFNCGSAPVTIPIASTIMFTKETVVDGGAKVTLDGGGSARMLYLDSDYNTKTPRLTVQRLAFTHGQGPATGDDTARGDRKSTRLNSSH